MLRVYVYPLANELLFGEVLTVALRAAGYQIVNDLEPNPPLDIVIVPVDSVEASCQLIGHITAQRPAATVVALGERFEEEGIVALIAAGARAYVDRNQSVSQLLFTLDAVVQQRAPASSRITANVIRKIRSLSDTESPSARIDVLTPRERSILHLMANGCTNKQIADDLEISSNTVKNHIHRILDKLQVRRRREAARLALIGAHGLPALCHKPAASERKTLTPAYAGSGSLR